MMPSRRTTTPFRFAATATFFLVAPMLPALLITLLPLGGVGRGDGDANSTTSCGLPRNATTPNASTAAEPRVVPCGGSLLFYVLFQIIYTLGSIPVTLFAFHYTIPGLLTARDLAVVLIANVVMSGTYSGLYYTDAFPHFSLALAVGSLPNTLLIATIYLVKCIRLRRVGVRTLVGSPVAQWGRALTLHLAVTGVYFLSTLTTELFGDYTPKTGSTATAGPIITGGGGFFSPVSILFFVFSAFSFMVLPKLGRWADAGIKDMAAAGHVSMRQALELASLIFYFTFYRNLFVDVASWGHFFQLKALSLGLEVVMYPCRATTSYYRFSTIAEQSLHDAAARIRHGVGAMLCGCGAALFREGGREEECSTAKLQLVETRIDTRVETRVEFVEYLRFSYGMRLYVVLTTALYFATLFSVIRLSHNSDRFLVFGTLPNASYERLLLFTLVSVMLELALFTTSSCIINRRGCGTMCCSQRQVSGGGGASGSTTDPLLVAENAPVHTRSGLSILVEHIGLLAAVSDPEVSTGLCSEQHPVSEEDGRGAADCNVKTLRRQRMLLTSFLMFVLAHVTTDIYNARLIDTHNLTVL